MLREKTKLKTKAYTPLWSACLAGCFFMEQTLHECCHAFSLFTCFVPNLCERSTLKAIYPALYKSRHLNQVSQTNITCVKSYKCSRCPMEKSCSEKWLWSVIVIPLMIALKVFNRLLIPTRYIFILRSSFLQLLHS